MQVGVYRSFQLIVGSLRCSFLVCRGNFPCKIGRMKMQVNACLKKICTNLIFGQNCMLEFVEFNASEVQATNMTSGISIQILISVTQLSRKLVELG